MSLAVCLSRLLFVSFFPFTAWKCYQDPLLPQAGVKEECVRRASQFQLQTHFNMSATVFLQEVVVVLNRDCFKLSCQMQPAATWKIKIKHQDFPNWVNYVEGTSPLGFPNNSSWWCVWWKKVSLQPGWKTKLTLWFRSEQENILSLYCQQLLM